MSPASGPKRVALRRALPSLTIFVNRSTVLPVPRNCQYSVSVSPLALEDEVDCEQASLAHASTVMA